MDMKPLAFIAVCVYYVWYLYNNGKFNSRRIVSGIVSFCLAATAILFNAFEHPLWALAMAVYAGLFIGGIL